ncbi:hypothetical protein [Mycobacterium sp.]|uniref:hypothetical protein n=1 Tax=Mycobacterium sp. TaxID=1785 RepID=UPI0025D2FF5E|nr:hypothetical protein [Mycobacterium sp.]
MSAQDSTAENSGGDSSNAAEQTQRAAEQSDRVGSYSPEQYPEDPSAATPPLDDESASEPPKSD